MNIISTDFVVSNVDNLTCRACLKSGGIGIMHSFTDTADGDRELRDLYKELTKIEIKLTDKRKPKLICGSCTSKLISAHEFITDAHRAEKLLSFHIKSSEDSHLLKQESDDINIEFINEDTNDADHRNDYTVEFIETEKNTENEANSEDSQEYESLDAVANEVELNCEITEDDAEEIYEEIDVIEGKPFSEFELLDENYFEVENLSETGTLIDRKKLGTTGTRLANGSKHQIKCDECPRRFAKEESFLRHKTTAHTFAPREEIFAKQQTEQNIFCPFCPRTFVHKNDLVRHVNAIHPDDAAKSPIEIEPKKQKRQYKKAMCPHCQKEFPQASIKIHIRRHLGINPYKCETCLKAFPRKQDLTVHIRQHTGEKPHVCSVCAKSFIRPNKLSRHMRIHLGIRPYTCHDCGKSFSQSNDLKIHQRRHTGEKPYACYCGESFISGTALRQHRKLKMHNEGDVPDPYDACRVNTRTNTEKVLHQNTEEILEFEEISEKTND